MSRRFEKAKEYTKKYGGMLLPCKYCGRVDIKIVSDRSLFPPRNVWGVCCPTPGCDCTGDHIKVIDAVNAWNEHQKQK